MIRDVDLKRDFTLPNKNISHLKPGIVPFNVVNKNSKKLLVTIGDSWSWGDELPQRIKNCYGNVLSDKLDSDWMNLSVPGAGNHYIGQLYLDFIKYIKKNNTYKHILCIVVMTETARDFDGWFDRNVDYANWLKNNIKYHYDYDKFLEFVNDFSIDQILSHSKTVSNLEILIGFNFVNTSSVKKLNSNLIKKTWLEVITNTELTDECYIVSPHIFDKLESIFSIEYSLDKSVFRQWQIDQIEKAKRRIELLSNAEHFYPRKHPKESGHVAWAEYLYTELKKSESKIIE